MGTMEEAPADVLEGAVTSPAESNERTPSDDVSKTQEPGQDGDSRDLIRRISRKVVPGLPRTKTFKRQQSEDRNKLEPLRTTQAERRAVSMDRRALATNNLQNQSDPRASAPGFFANTFVQEQREPSLPTSPIDEEGFQDARYLERFEAEVEEADSDDELVYHDGASSSDAQSVHSATTSQYDAMIHEELERTWILNLSMHFRDKSKREKFFVTYREHEHHWRRVTVSLDYRNAPDNSLELDLAHTKFQRDKSAKIYEAIRESLPDIQFYDTVTNLKLETRDGRLHVHVVEDVNVCGSTFEFKFSDELTPAVGNYQLPINPDDPTYGVQTGQRAGNPIRFAHVWIRLQGPGPWPSAHQKGNPRPRHG